MYVTALVRFISRYMRCDFVLPLTVDIGTEHRMSNPYQSDQLKVSPYTKVSMHHLVRDS